MIGWKLNIIRWFYTKILRRTWISYRYRYVTSVGPDTQIRLHEEVK